MKRSHTLSPLLAGRRRMAGFSIVELMTAMLISMLLIAATVSVFVSNKRVYSATEGLGRIQESGRIAFELMTRDIREAGGNPCDVRMKVVNVLSDTTSWWATYTPDSGVFGFDEGSFTGSTAGTDAIQVRFFEDTGLVTSAGMGSTTGNLALTAAGIDTVATRQIMMVCGFFPSSPTEPVTDAVTIFSAGKSGTSLIHDVDSGNARTNFTDAGQPTAVVYPANSLLGSLRAMEWYVAENGRGGNSLYRRQLRYPGTAPAMGDPEEIIDNVIGMQLTYLNDAGTWSTGLPGSWNNLTAVQVDLELEASDNRAGGVEGEMIRRRLTHVIALRNKLQ